MLLIFDFDGTLADTWPWLARELVEGAARLGYRQLTRAQVEALRGLSTSAVFESLGINESLLPSVVADLRVRADLSSNGFPLFPGIADMIQLLCRKQHTLALVSSNSEMAVRNNLDKSLQSHFAFFRCDVPIFAKEAAFREISRSAKARLADTLVIGDETRDLVAAEGAGIEALAVEWGFTEAQTLRAGNARTAATVQQLTAMILDWSQGS